MFKRGFFASQKFGFALRLTVEPRVLAMQGLGS
jgi:hypothetical protein